MTYWQISDGRNGTDRGYGLYYDEGELRRNGHVLQTLLTANSGEIPPSATSQSASGRAHAVAPTRQADPPRDERRARPRYYTSSRTPAWYRAGPPSPERQGSHDAVFVGE